MKGGIIKFCYKVAACWLFLLNHTAMHGSINIKSYSLSSTIISLYCFSSSIQCTLEGRNSSVGIATCYGLDGPEIESRWGRDFSHTSRPALGPTQPPTQWILGLSRGVKRPRRGIGHPPSSNAEVKERINLYSPSGLSWLLVD
jgi:hypothetical protein